MLKPEMARIIDQQRHRISQLETDLANIKRVTEPRKVTVTTATTYILRNERLKREFMVLQAKGRKPVIINGEIKCRAIG